jgi:hypothetical protein
LNTIKIDDYDTRARAEQSVRELLIGRKVVAVEQVGDNLYEGIRHVATLDNGTVLEFMGNDGCGGCSEGWFKVDELNRMDNAIMSVEFDRGEKLGQWGTVDVFRIFVYSENESVKLLEVSGHDNGYYGTGYYVTVRLPEND